MNLIKKIWKKFIDKYYYLAISISCILITIYFYKTSGLSIFNGIYIVLGIYSLFKFFNKEYKIFNVFPKNKLILLISLIFLTSMTHVYYDHDYIVRSQNTEGKSISDAILVEPVEKEISISEGKFDSIGIQFATYKRKNKKAFYNITLIKNGKTIFTGDYNASTFEDSKYSEISVGKQVSNKNDKFKLIIKPIYADSSNCISYYTNEDSSSINYQVTNKNFNLVKDIMIVSLIVIFAGINYITNSKNIKPEKFYLILSLYFIPLVFIVPSYDIPDEPVHHLRSYKLSEITNKDDKISNPRIAYLYAPDIKCLSYGQFQDASSRFNWVKFKKCINKNDNVRQYNYEINNLSLINPVAHIMPAIGIKIADTFSNSALIIFMAGRLVNCLISILGISYAIKRTKSNKLILLFVVTIPIFVQQMISYSYDSLLNTSCIIVTAMIINILSNEKLRKSDYIVTSMSLTYIACSKYLYLLIITPLLFFSNKKGIKEYLKEHRYIFLIMLMPFVLFITWKITSLVGTQPVLVNAQNQSNITYILKNPIKLFSIAFNTIKMNGWFYVQSLFGYFGWFIFRFANYIYFVYIFVVYLIIKSTKTSNVIMFKKVKTVSIISSLVIVGGVFASMYFGWSTYALKYVDGVQGRYFIPILAILLVSFVPKRKKEYNIDDKDIYIFANLSILLYAITLICNIY